MDVVGVWRKLFPWGKSLPTPYNTTDKPKQDSIRVQLGEPSSLLGLLTEHA